MDEMDFREWFADGSIPCVEVPIIIRGVLTNNDQRRIAYGELTLSITMFRRKKDSTNLKKILLKRLNG